MGNMPQIAHSLSVTCYSWSKLMFSDNIGHF